MKSTTAPRKDTRYVWIRQDNFGPRKVGFELLGGPVLNWEARGPLPLLLPLILAFIHRWPQTSKGGCVAHIMIIAQKINMV